MEGEIVRVITADSDIEGSLIHQLIVCIGSTFGYKIMESKEKCEFCRKDFVPVRSSQRFCSEKCNQSSWNERSRRIPAGLSVEQRTEIDELIEKFQRENQAKKKSIVFKQSSQSRV